MAGRPMGKLHQEDVRAKIKTSHLVRRLQQHIDGEIKLDPSQINAIKILLDKTLASLSATELTGDVTINQIERIERVLTQPDLPMVEQVKPELLQ
jgi:hypothetical protein